MFANTTRFNAQDPDDQPLVEEVHVTKPVPANPKLERTILICWVLIAIKHVLIIWAVHHYPVPFHQLWINFPTWALGVMATFAYYARE